MLTQIHPPSLPPSHSPSLFFGRAQQTPTPVVLQTLTCLWRRTLRLSGKKPIDKLSPPLRRLRCFTLSSSVPVSFNFTLVCYSDSALSEDNRLDCWKNIFFERLNPWKTPVWLPRFVEILVILLMLQHKATQKCESLLKLRFVLALNFEFSIQYYDLCHRCHF